MAKQLNQLCPAYTGQRKSIKQARPVIHRLRNMYYEEEAR